MKGRTEDPRLPQDAARREKKRGGRWLLPALLLLTAALALLWFLGGRLEEAYGEPAAGTEQTAEEAGYAQAAAEDWPLVLVDRDHRLPRDYQLELTTLDNGEQVDERIYPDLQAMFDDARAAGLQLFVAAGYRTYGQQQALMAAKVAELRQEGCSRLEAKRQARQWVALPGSSEHQLGIAVDINADTEVSASDEVYAWLAENSYKYGFIYRYPPDKTEITGIVNEPWHYRYVGYEAAYAIWSQGLCLEEYLAELN